MANGQSFSSLTLDRRAKRGRVSTAGTELPASFSAIGAVDDPAAAGISVDDLDFLHVGSSPLAPIAPTAAVQAEVTDLPALAPENKAQEDSSLRAGKLTHMPGAAFAGLASLSSSRAMPEPPKAKEYLEAQSPFAGLEKPGTGIVERSARRDVHAVKVVTRLVRAIAFKPGSDAHARIKSEELMRMLGEVHRAANAVAMAAAPLDAHRGWVHAMCSEAMAELVASRNENDTFGERLNIDDAIRVITELFEASETKEYVADAISALRNSGYVEATSESISTDRVRASTGLAAWDLYDSVMHPRLGVGDFRYTYDHRPEEIVALLCEEAVRIAREMNIRTSNLDARTMHLQGSIRRAGALLGSEYVNRTRQIMNWIGEDGSSDEEYERRCAESKAGLKTVVLPQIVELTRRNFIAIEQIAPQLLEESKNAHPNPQRENAN